MFEVGSLVFPAAKAGLLAKLGKVEVFNHLMTKGRLIGAKARQAMTALRTPLQVTRMCFVAGTLVKAKQGLIKIEDVRPGMEVWSRDEFTQEEGWKPVAQTFITHPAELHHLTYEVRGPPAEGEAVRCETLGVTAPHPFWVSSRSKAGFVPAGELRAGDELSLANGGHAIVTANTRETAPLGETFTTYNFEVADFHTYFAGRSEVWVHNDCPWPIEKAIAAYRVMLDNVGGDRWSAFNNAMGALLRRGDMINYEQRRLYLHVQAEFKAAGGAANHCPRIPCTTDAENILDDFFRNKSDWVEPNPFEDAPGAGMQFDRMINGIATEYLSPTTTNADNLTAAIARKARDTVSKKANQLVVDVTGQPNWSTSVRERAIARARGAAPTVQVRFRNGDVLE